LLASLPAGGQMIATDVVGVFLVPMKVALAVAFLIGPALRAVPESGLSSPRPVCPREKAGGTADDRIVLLFFIGMAFAYFAFFPMVFGFMAKFAPDGVAWMTDIEKYFSFVLTMFLAFGVTFEVPVIVIVLVKIGVVNVVKLREWRPYVIVGAFVVGAVFTPPDVISQFMMAVPLWLLYELGIVLANLIVRPEPEGKTDYKAPSDEEMDRELDRAERESRDQAGDRRRCAAASASLR
jgi:sec-independent protein translocase protein TatC